MNEPVPDVDLCTREGAGRFGGLPGGHVDNLVNPLIGHEQALPLLHIIVE